jgi:putative transposase
VPGRLRRKNNTGHLHFITSSCYHRQPILGKECRRDCLLKIFEQVRHRYQFIVVGYVVMPEHIHLLISEPGRGSVSTVMQVMKQRFARNVLRELRTPSTLQQPSLWQGAMEDAHIWQKRFYDFVVLSEKKKLEKLRYIHRNPVRRGLVLAPEQWKWSSYPHYSTGELGPVFIDQGARSVLKIRSPHSP